MSIGFGHLRLAPAAFWAMTPRELAAAIRPAGPAGVAPMRRADLAALSGRFPDEAQG